MDGVADAEALPGLLLLHRWVEAVELDASAGRTQQRGQHLDGGRFAGAVGAEKGEYLSLRDVKRDVLDSGKVAEGLDQIPDGDHPDGFLLRVVPAVH